MSISPEEILPNGDWEQGYYGVGLCPWLDDLLGYTCYVADVGQWVASRVPTDAERLRHWLAADDTQSIMGAILEEISLKALHLREALASATVEVTG